MPFWQDGLPEKAVVNPKIEKLKAQIWLLQVF